MKKTQKMTHVVGLTIPADMGRPMELVAIPNTLEGMQRMVGNCLDEKRRYIEAVELGRGVLMYADENGLDAGWQANARAMLVAKGAGYDLIVGDVVVIGTTEDGEDESLLPEDAAHVLKVVTS